MNRTAENSGDSSHLGLGIIGLIFHLKFYKTIYQMNVFLLKKLNFTITVPGTWLFLEAFDSTRYSENLCQILIFLLYKQYHFLNLQVQTRSNKFGANAL